MQGLQVGTPHTEDDTRAVYHRARSGQSPAAARDPADGCTKRLASSNGTHILHAAHRYTTALNSRVAHQLSKTPSKPSGTVTMHPPAMLQWRLLSRSSSPASSLNSQAGAQGGGARRLRLKLPRLRRPRLLPVSDLKRWEAAVRVLHSAWPRSCPQHGHTAMSSVWPGTASLL